jgi:hypothetical protein
MNTLPRETPLTLATSDFEDGSDEESLSDSDDSEPAATSRFHERVNSRPLALPSTPNLLPEAKSRLPDKQRMPHMI